MIDNSASCVPLIFIIAQIGYRKKSEQIERKSHNMKHQREFTKGKQTAAAYRRARIERIVCTILRFILVMSTILFVWITDLGCAFGWMRNAKAGENWPMAFVAYGQTMIAASVLLTVGAVLVLLRLNRTALLTASGGITLCMIVLYRVTTYASESGFYSKLMDMPADVLYRTEILPTWIAYGSLAALALMQYFSFETRRARRAKKQKENMKAPSILE